MGHEDGEEAHGYVHRNISIHLFIHVQLREQRTYMCIDPQSEEMKRGEREREQKQKKQTERR